MVFKRFLLFVLCVLTFAIPSPYVVYAVELSSDQTAAVERLFDSNDLMFRLKIGTDGSAILTVEGHSFEFDIKTTSTVSDLISELEEHQYTGIGAVEPSIADLTIEEVINSFGNADGLNEVADSSSGVFASALEGIMPISENDVPVAASTPQPAWMSIPITAGDPGGVYMRAKTNKQGYAIGEVIYTTVYVSGLDGDKDSEKEVLIRVEGYGIAPVALSSETISGTASGIVGVVASRDEAVKLDIVVEYGNNQTLIGSLPLMFGTTSVQAPESPLSSQAPPVNIALTDSGKKGGNLPKTSDVSPSNYAVGSLAFVITVICFAIVIQLAQKKKASRNTISSMMYDRGYIYGGRMDIYSKKEDSHEKETN